MDISKLEFIKAKLSEEEKPGEEAHRLMMSYNRAVASEARSFDPPPKESAVLMILHPRNNELHTLFIQRPENQGVHSGQISFPGGKKELTDDDLLSTAYRETFEEIGLEESKLEYLGALSELYIPPSNFIVQPYVAFCDHEPQLTPSAEEVSEVIHYPLGQLLNQNELQKKKIYLQKFDLHLEVPYFDIYGKTLWGATAMMIAEFKLLIQK
jgi:8-oxo-dGTP pyrophosphatase MutT (NUDIX family)